MENATVADLYARACQQWREAVELDLHRSEDIVYGLMPLLVQGLGHDPDHLPSLDLLSDMLMEVGAYDEAVEFAEKMLDLAPDDADYKQKMAVLADEVDNRRRVVRVYLHQKRLRLTKDATSR
ncbi:MAG: tetratricopeptide repeat protein [Candidatus Competibacter sp.]|jgi:tetratricopeptide (TPR) repeat protein